MINLKLDLINIYTFGFRVIQTPQDIQKQTAWALDYFKATPDYRVDVRNATVAYYLQCQLAVYEYCYNSACKRTYKEYLEKIIPNGNENRLCYAYLYFVMSRFKKHGNEPSQKREALLQKQREILGNLRGYSDKEMNKNSIELHEIFKERDELLRPQFYLEKAAYFALHPKEKIVYLAKLV